MPGHKPSGFHAHLRPRMVSVVLQYLISEQSPEVELWGKSVSVAVIGRSILSALLAYGSDLFILAVG